MRLIAPLAAFMAIALSTAGAQASGGDVAAVRARLDARMRQLADSGWSGAIVVARNDTVLLESGYGLANRDQKIPFTANTIAQVGSLTKQFTATAIAQLMHERRLTARDSIATFFKDVPIQARGLTVEMLLTHTAGLPDDCGGGDFTRISKHDLLTRCLALPFISAPGTTYRYSNLGYSVLGAIVEHVSGKQIERYLREDLFAPLGIGGIAYSFPGVPLDRFATGYTTMGMAQPPMHVRLSELNGDAWNLLGNGGMQASAHMMYEWYRALEASPRISDDVRTMLFTPRAFERAGLYYGYGWNLRSDSAGKVVQVSHSGSDGTFLSLWYWRPQEHVFIYSVTNFGEGDLAALTVSKLAKVLSADR
jgi:CubicO group peptidase (beta-lactamase class C family)